MKKLSAADKRPVGRPKTLGDTVVRSYNLPVELDAEITDKARRLGVSRSAVVVAAIKKGLGKVRV